VSGKAWPTGDRFEIGGRSVGAGQPVYVIAEVGANHNRDIGIARELIDVAAGAGADAVKFQTYSGDRIYSRKTPRFEYLKGISEKTPAELLEEISLPREWQEPLRDYAVERGIQWFSSPFDHEAVAELDALDVPALKIASFEIVDLPLIRRAAETSRPLLISTGMATMEEIGEALEAAGEGGASAVGLMQCTSVYPAPAERANLRAMATMRSEFGVPVGLSDHTEGIVVPIAAAALGAAFVEKHFTLDRSMKGPDHPFAIEPDELEAMVRGIREAQAGLGDGSKSGPGPEESEEMYRLARRSLIVTRDLPAGTVLEPEMITVKRPGYGIAPKHLEEVVGRALSVSVEDDDILTWEMLEPGDA
jgi:N,N'-diacetyllegionaminate synthase